MDDNRLRELILQKEECERIGRDSDEHKAIRFKILRREKELLHQELEKYKAAVKYFKDNGFADIVKNLTDY